MMLFVLLVVGIPSVAQSTPDKNDTSEKKIVEIRDLANYVNSTAITVEGVTGELQPYSSTLKMYQLSKRVTKDSKDTIWVKTDKNYPDKDRTYHVTGTVIREGEQLYLVEQERELYSNSNEIDENKDGDKGNIKKWFEGIELTNNMKLGIGLIAIALIIGTIIFVSMRKQANEQKMMLEQQRQTAERERERIQKAAMPLSSGPINATTVASDSFPGGKVSMPKKVQHTVEAWGQLKVTSGPHTGLIAPLTGRQITIGRSEGDLQLPDDSMVSTNHAEIVSTNDGRLLFVDKSRNGSIVDGKPVHRSQVDIKTDSIIEVGSSRIEIFTMRPPVIASKPVESPFTVAPPKSDVALTMMGDVLPPNLSIVNPTGNFMGVEFVVISGADANKRFPVGKESITIGRRDNQDIVLTDGFVSREHAICSRQGSDWVIRNLSDKGITVNGEPSTESIIKHGDRINLGSTVMEFNVVDEMIQRSSKTICE